VTEDRSAYITEAIEKLQNAAGEIEDAVIALTYADPEATAEGEIPNALQDAIGEWQQMVDRLALSAQWLQIRLKGSETTEDEP
jgi:hypothetical protein